MTAAAMMATVTMTAKNNHGGNNDDSDRDDGDNDFMINHSHQKNMKDKTMNVSVTIMTSS